MVISWESNQFKAKIKTREVRKTLKDIYIIKNDINNKVYIGQAKDTKQRFQSHCKPSAAILNNELIAKAIQKYGKQHFWYEILEKQIENYNEKEKYWIKYYNSILPNGYNILTGGECPPIMGGIYHPESKLNQQQVDELTKDLEATKLSMSELANKYGFESKTSISEFNKGITYVRNIKYPIRKENPKGKLTNNDIEEIIILLEKTYRSFESIGAQYGVEARTISRINKGMFHKRNIEYPIRDWKATSTAPKLQYEQVTEIISLLLDTKKSLREIAKLFNVEYKDILNIKNGTTKIYRRKDLVYPLRSNN